MYTSLGSPFFSHVPRHASWLSVLLLRLFIPIEAENWHKKNAQEIGEKSKKMDVRIKTIRNEDKQKVKYKEGEEREETPDVVQWDRSKTASTGEFFSTR